MKKNFLLFLALFCLTTMQAKVILNEHFDRDLGQLSQGSMQDDMNADTQNWWYTASATTYIQVIDNNLTYAGYQTEANGKAVQLSGNTNKDVRAFNQVTASPGNSVYYSLLFNVESLPSTDKNYIVALWMDKYNTAAKQQFAQLKIAANEGQTTFRLGISKSNESRYRMCPQDLQRNTTYLVVVRYDFVDGEKNDVVSMWINPTKVSEGIPSLVCVQDSLNLSNENKGASSMDDATHFGMIYLHPMSTTPKMTIDELRIATKWAELFEEGSVQPDPAIGVEPSVDFGELTVGEPAERKLNITAENLTEDLAITHTNTELALSTNAIAKEVAMSGTKLTLTVTPVTEGSQTDKITIASGGYSVEVNVSWTAKKADGPGETPDPQIEPKETHLLQNGGFEEYTASSFMGAPTTEYAFWSFSGGMFGATTEGTDKLEGENAFKTNSEFKNNGTLYQSLDVTDYNTGDEFELRINYKILTPQGDNPLRLASYWRSSKDGELADDADILKVDLPNSDTWKEVIVRTKKPEKATSFEFTLSITGKTILLFDDFAFDYLEPDAYFSVSPETIKAVETNVNTELLMATLVIRQNGLTQPVNLYIGGENSNMFKLDKTSVSAAEETVQVTYAPTEAGHHSATLSVYDDESVEISLFNRTISLTGTAVDPTKTPTITISPTSLPDFSCVAKEEVNATIDVTSENCTDYIYVSIENTQGSAFLIDGSMLSKNTPAQTVVTFKPVEAGTYAATITWKTEGGTPVTLSVTGTATAATPEDIDYATDFVWDASNPLDYMDEGFDLAADYRNKTLKVSGWQNVVTKGDRAWWGYSLESDLVAKATGYFFNVSGEHDAEMWLVTPALNFNTPYFKQFGFNILGEIIFDGQQGGVELYYIDATTDPVHMEHISDVDALIPANDNELANTWTPVVADLTGQPLADVFFIAFRFYDKAGSNGVTYWLDNVSWGKQLLDPQAVETVSSGSKPQLIIQNGQIFILRDGRTYTITGAEVR